MPLPKPIGHVISQLSATAMNLADQHLGGEGGPFDFSRQTNLLRVCLEGAVPLWSAQLIRLEKDDQVEFQRTLRRWAEEGAIYLAAHGDALMYRVKDTSKEAFNHLARGIACLAFCPGGVTCFGTRWEYTDIVVPPDVLAGPFERG